MLRRVVPRDLNVEVRILHVYTITNRVGQDLILVGKILDPKSFFSLRSPYVLVTIESPKLRQGPYLSRRRSPKLVVYRRAWVSVEGGREDVQSFF